MMYKTSNYVKLVAFMLVGLFMFSCNHDGDEKPFGQTVSTDIYFKLQNKQGENLFDPSVKRHYNVDDMKLFHLKNDGGKVELAETGNVILNGLELQERDKSLRLITYLGRFKLVRKIDAETRIFENTAYLQLTENDTDTIVSHLQYHHKGQASSSIVMKAWYNGQLFWEREKGQIANIVKNQNN